jgi:hypothetical protein
VFGYPGRQQRSPLCFCHQNPEEIFLLSIRPIRALPKSPSFCVNPNNIWLKDDYVMMIHTPLMISLATFMFLDVNDNYLCILTSFLPLFGC